jgi:hypothetical protein
MIVGTEIWAFTMGSGFAGGFVGGAAHAARPSATEQIANPLKRLFFMFFLLTPRAKRRLSTLDPAPGR